MQTVTRSDVGQRLSTTAARRMKTPGSDSSSASSPNPVAKTPKTVDRRPTRTSATEKKRPIKASESETRISHLQEELKKTKEQLIASESCKKRAQREAEEAKHQLAAISAQLNESQNQLKELTESEEARIHELRKLSQERDREWQSELDSFQKQYSMDSAALSSAMNEIQKLKMQMDRVLQSEASLRVELTETLVLVERLKNQLNESRDYEARAIEEVSRAQREIEVVKKSEEELKLEYDSVVESYNSLLLELEESKKRVTSLEELVASLRSDLSNSSKKNEECDDDDDEEALNLRNEVNQLRLTMKDAERRYRDEYIESTLQIRDAYELVEATRLKSSQRESELESKLKESRDEVDELRSKMNSSSGEKQGTEDLKASLLQSEEMLITITEENRKLKCEMMKAENEALMKLNSLEVEADKGMKKAARATEQLDAAEACSSELEAELRRLKVQCNQWRKAAEAAAAMLATGSNGKCVERSGSFDYHSIAKKVSYSCSEDTDDDSPKKRNGNMLRKIGVLLKKGQK